MLLQLMVKKIVEEGKMCLGIVTLATSFRIDCESYADGSNDDFSFTVIINGDLA